MEHALKALTIAQGRRVKHKHSLNELWDEVERHGETIHATRDRAALDVLSKYGAELQYNSPGREYDPEVTWNGTKVTGQDLLRHARTRVPELIEETTKRVRNTLGSP